MKKNLSLILILFISPNVFALACEHRISICPNTECPSKMLMGDDGKCYPCDEKENINVDCIGKERAEQICPNRIIQDYCGIVSTFCPQNDCTEGTFLGDDGKCYNCDEKNEISVSCIGEKLSNKLCPNRAVYNCVGTLKSHICSFEYEIKNNECCKIENQDKTCIKRACIS